MIDSHAHLNDEKLLHNVEKIIELAHKNGIKKIITVGFDLKSSITAVELAEKYQCIYAVIGVHPHNSQNYNEAVENHIKNLAKSKKVLAIGEIGLDYYYDLSPRDVQKAVFEKQIKLANELHLPIVVHTREAIGDTMNILNKYKDILKNNVLIHCFNASADILKIVSKNNWKVSFGGAITFKNANHLVDCVKNCPIENILLETDCPYMTPVPFRGELNTPDKLIYVANKIAQIKEIDVQDVIKTTEKNTIAFFKMGDFYE